MTKNEQVMPDYNYAYHERQKNEQLMPDSIFTMGDASNGRGLWAVSTANLSANNLVVEGC